jgi:hypothetical protein
VEAQAPSLAQRGIRDRAAYAEDEIDEPLADVLLLDDSVNFERSLRGPPPLVAAIAIARLALKREGGRRSDA